MSNPPDSLGWPLPHPFPTVFTREDKELADKIWHIAKTYGWNYVQCLWFAKKYHDWCKEFRVAPEKVDVLHEINYEVGFATAKRDLHELIKKYSELTLAEKAELGKVTL